MAVIFLILTVSSGISLLIIGVTIGEEFGLSVIFGGTSDYHESSEVRGAKTTLVLVLFSILLMVGLTILSFYLWYTKTQRIKDELLEIELMIAKHNLKKTNEEK